VSVPTVMGDETTSDVWYPYWRVEGSPTGRECWFPGPDGEHWVHVTKLRVGDKVAFTPSTFDFEYLDTTARRFEVSYDDGQRRFKGNYDDGQQHGVDKHQRSYLLAKRQRPYLLEELDNIEKVWAEVSQVSKSQIRMIESLIETKRRDWLTVDTPEAQATAQATFCQFVRDVLHKTNIHTDLLESAALSGMLNDALELHLTIAKEGKDRNARVDES
ncbi:MAG: hypothetical protein U9Q70_06525, partial [Chloroflexota bacterium]|nr:hypothetical protein [Chloroflexota bacterium]